MMKDCNDDRCDLFEPCERHARRPEEIKVTRSLGAAMSDSEIGGWQVSYCERGFQTKALAEVEADRLRYWPTAAETQAMREGRFVDE